MEECCKNELNRMSMQVEDRDDLVISICMICYRRHFELTAESGSYNLKIH